MIIKAFAKVQKYFQIKSTSLEKMILRYKKNNLPCILIEPTLESALI